MSIIGDRTSPGGIEAMVVQTYRTARSAGADEWSACDAALQTFLARHPEASAEFANLTVARILSDCEVGTPEWSLPPALSLAKPLAWS